MDRLAGVDLGVCQIPGVNRIWVRVTADHTEHQLSFAPTGPSVPDHMLARLVRAAHEKGDESSELDRYFEKLFAGESIGHWPTVDQDALTRKVQIDTRRSPGGQPTSNQQFK